MKCDVPACDECDSAGKEGKKKEKKRNWKILNRFFAILLTRIISIYAERSRKKRKKKKKTKVSFSYSISSIGKEGNKKILF